MTGKRLVVSINSSWNFINFRAGLMRALAAEGYEIIAAAPQDEYTSKLGSLGCQFQALSLSGRGTSPIKDAVLFLGYLKLLRRTRPAAFIGFTVKPNVFGSLAAHFLGIPVINNIAGLGAAFADRGWLNRVVRQLYRIALRKSAVVFFQNPDDRDQFVREGLVRAEVTRLLPGSGVDTVRFAPRAQSPRPPGDDVFLMIVRMLWAKGVGDYVDAARAVHRQYPDAKFQILGIVDEGANGAIRRVDIDRWESEGAIQFLGTADDVRPHLANADCIVLPSYYREGTPRSLLEAAAMGKPLIATDVPGCREVVKHGVNGFLVPPRNSTELAESMIQFIELSHDKKRLLALASRRIAEREFDERLVIELYLEAIRQVNRTEV